MTWKNLLIKPVFGCVENENSPIAIVGAPLDSTGTYRPGTRFAPQRIREASCNLELYSLIADIVLEDIGFKDYGDVLIPLSDLNKSLSRIEYVIGSISQEHSELLMILGGEHLLTYSSIRGLKNKIDTLVVFDAHLDMRGEYLDSNINHATFLRKLIEEGVDILHIGSRAYSGDELSYLRSRSVKIYNIIDVYRGDLKLDNIGKVYISVDMDVFDPSIAPGVSNPEPFGLDTHRFLELLKDIIEKTDDITAVDVVEVNPLVDTSDVTSHLAAKILLEIAGLYLKRRFSK
ncbi:MAG: agmatinase [Desulfurococcaceae archaeon]